MVAWLGGERYRVTVGMLLAFVVGPAMRFAIIPMASGLAAFAVRTRVVLNQGRDDDTAAQNIRTPARVTRSQSAGSRTRNARSGKAD